MADIFLSYAHEDLERARHVADALGSEGLDVFWDHRIPPGRTWEDYIGQQITHCRAMVVLWSPHAVASKWVKREAAAGRDRDILIPALIATTDIPFGYRDVHAADLRDWKLGAYSIEFDEVVRAIRSHVPAAESTPVETQQAHTAPVRTRSPAPNTAARPPVAPLENGRPASSLSTPQWDPVAQDARRNRSPSTDAESVEPSLTNQHADRILEWVRHGLRSEWVRPIALLLTVIVLSIYGLRRFYIRPAQSMSPSQSTVQAVPASSPARVGVAAPQSGASPPTPSENPDATPRQLRRSSQAKPASPTGQSMLTGEQRSRSEPPTSAPSERNGPQSGRGEPPTQPSFRSDAWNLPDEPLLGFVEIPAGPFLMGSDGLKDPNAYPDERWGNGGAQGRLELPAYYIGRYEVTVAQFKTFVNATKTDLGNGGGFNAPNDFPVRSVSWSQAMRYGQWLEDSLKDSSVTPPRLKELLRQGWHIALPSEAEWEKAARGTDGRIYPWDGPLDPTRANYGGHDRRAVGSFPAGASPYGLLDMIGNVREWTRSLYKDYPYDPTDGREDPNAKGLRVVRGASSEDFNGLRAADRGRDYPVTQNPTIGFRLAVTRLPF